MANGIGFFGVLTILFIALKLTGYITWSWFWVLSPFLLPIILGVSIFLFGFILVIMKG